MGCKHLGQPQASLDFQPHLAEATLSEIFSYLQQSGCECYIAIDEFQQVAEYPEDGVEAVNASAFMKKYNLKGTSSINKALSFLIDNEYAYRTTEGYIVYDRFMNLWLKKL